MSRIGKLPILLPKDVDVIVNDNLVSIKGPCGKSELAIPSGIGINLNDRTVSVSVLDNTLKNRALHGAIRTLLFNDISGVHKEFEIELEFIGVGYRCEVKGPIVILRLGYSHPIELSIPTGVTVTVDKNTNISIKGAKKEVISQFAAQIRAFRPPEPYNGKGVLYKGEQIIRKAGKSGKK